MKVFINPFHSRKNLGERGSKIYIRGGFILIAIGLMGLFLPFLSLGFFSEPAFLDQVVQDQENFPSAYVSADSNIPNDLVASASLLPVSTNKPTPNPEAPDVSNRLVIAGASINMALIQSKSSGALWKGGWVFPDTSTPDKGGNTVIFGHRFRYLPPVSNTLYSLDKVNVGDIFYIVWNGLRYTYKVTEKKVIDPTDLSVLNKTEDSRVTIVTCFPLFSTKQRLVIVGTFQ